MTNPTGVGIIGAGPVTQAIHLPSLAKVGTLFRVAVVMDVNPRVAATVAAHASARATDSVDDLLEDPAVEVAVVCSPHRFHAEQVIAACRAGKRVVLCEKPLAMDLEEAEAIAAVSRETHVPIVVGAMHTFDPGWLAAITEWNESGQQAIVVDSSIVLPSNDRYEDWATEISNRPTGTGQGLTTARTPATAIRDALLGLAVHDLPLVRAFVPRIAQVDWAEWIDPWGYLVWLRGENGEAVRLLGQMHQYWHPQWTLDVKSLDSSLQLEFTPSYVHAGSSMATLTAERVSTTLEPLDRNGYEREWLRVAEIVGGASYTEEDLRVLVEDLTYALGIADEAAAFLRNANQ